MCLTTLSGQYCPESFEGATFQNTVPGSDWCDCLMSSCSWKRLEEPKHYESSSAVVASVGETPINSAPPATATATAIEADTPLFVEYPTLGTRCRVMAQSGAGLSLGNIFEILKHNPVLQGALGLALDDETTASSASKTTALPLSRLRLSLTQDGSNVEYVLLYRSYSPLLCPFLTPQLRGAQFNIQVPFWIRHVCSNRGATQGKHGVVSSTPMTECD